MKAGEQLRLAHSGSGPEIRENPSDMGVYKYTRATNSDPQSALIALAASFSSRCRSSLSLSHCDVTNTRASGYISRSRCILALIREAEVQLGGPFFTNFLSRFYMYCRPLLHMRARGRRHFKERLGSTRFLRALSLCVLQPRFSTFSTRCL